MSTNTTSIYRRDANGITYSSPASPDFLVRLKTTKRPKVLDNLRTDNVATEIIISDKHLVSRDNSTADDLLSVRIRVSGSVLSHDRLKEILTGVAAQLPTWAAENVVLGFEPNTPPNKY